MSEYDERTQLWNYRNNKVPGRGRHSFNRDHNSARAYELYGDDEYGHNNDRERPYQPYDRYSESRDQRDYGAGRRDYSGQYYDQHNGGYEANASRYGSDDYAERSGRGSSRRNYDVGHGRDDDYRRAHGYGIIPMWPSELGFPPISTGTRRGYSDYRDRSRPGDDQNERGFFERAGDEFMSWFGDRDAIRRREQDHRGRGPKAYVRSDERIREDVNDRLTEDNWIDASDIDVTVSEGEVTLSGTVNDRHSKRRAEDVTDGITGVKHVQNNLRYGSTTTEATTPSDRSL